MADRKYTNLPGLAPDDEPDTFETDDRPEADQTIDYEEDSDAVEQLHVSTSDAFNTFKDKSLDGRQADFSDRLRHTRNTGYSARAGQWELAGQGQPETVVQKYQRLKLELHQLEEEIAGVQAGLKGEDGASSDASNSQIPGEVEHLQRHLATVSLEQLFDAEVLNALGDPQGALRSKLELQVAQLSAGPGADSKPAKSAGEVASYELHLRPQQAAGQHADSLASLESRLQAMERAVGAAPDKMSRLSAETRHKSLLAAVAALSSKVALLEPGMLEAAEGRLQALHQRMNQLAETKPAGIAPEKLAAVCELYETMQKTAGIQAELPAILGRLTSLQTLHDQAQNFSRALTQLETAQQKVETSLSQGEAQLGQVQSECAAALATVQKGLDAVSARVDALHK